MGYGMVYYQDHTISTFEDLDDYYECYFAKRKELNGKRFPVTMYVRAYVD